MHKLVYRTSLRIVLVITMLTVFLSPPGETVQAFNQDNLIRVAEVREVDGQYYFRRIAPVSDFQP